MKLEMTGQMRMEQKMKLAPRMIQSMEILQLPLMALQERIDQELSSNPVLEVAERLVENASETTEADIEGNDTEAEYFGQNEGWESNDEYIPPSSRVRVATQGDEVDKKLEAIKNTAAPAESLHDYLSEQWRLMDAEEAVKTAGQLIIDYVNKKGYLSVRIEQLYTKGRSEFSMDDLYTALGLVQQLEPAGVGARDLKECLLIQMRQSETEMGFEMKLVEEHLEDLLENRLPEVARKMNCGMDDINLAIKRLSKLDTSPGLQIGEDRNNPISADVIIEKDEDEDDWRIRLADNDLPDLRVNDYYKDMARDKGADERTKRFLKSNIRSARWIIEAIEQRRNTLLKVARSIVHHQREFFEESETFLKPLPMSAVADDIGVHVATVSRAVAGKYLQCEWGIFALRSFFSGGTEDAEGNAISWQAIRAELQKIIDNEDKNRPLSDDKIRDQLVDAGIENIARRTVAKYRKLMNIPSARLRKKY